MSAESQGGEERGSPKRVARSETGQNEAEGGGRRGESREQGERR